MKKLFIFLLIVCLPLSVQAQTHLASVAATLHAGQWAVLNIPGDSSGYGNPIWPLWSQPGNPCGTPAGSGWETHEFSAKATYGISLIATTPGTNGVAQRVYWIGGTHDGTLGASAPCVAKDRMTNEVYDIAANAWYTWPYDGFQQLLTGSPSTGEPNLHTYQLETFVPSLNKFYYMFVGTNALVGIDTDFANPSNFTWPDFTNGAESGAGYSAANPEPPDAYGSGATGANLNFGAIENFPERGSILDLNVVSTSNISHLLEKKLNQDSTSAISNPWKNGGPAGCGSNCVYDFGNAGNPGGAYFFGDGGPHMLHEAKNHGIAIFGGGGARMYWVTAPSGFRNDAAATNSGNLLVTRMDDFPDSAAGCPSACGTIAGNQTTLSWDDSVSGHIVVLQAIGPFASDGATCTTTNCVHFWEWDPAAATGSQWTERTDLETPCSNTSITVGVVYDHCMPPFGVNNVGGFSALSLANQSSVGLWDQGVVMVFGYAVWIMKLHDNNYADQGLSTDLHAALLPGKTGYVPFEHFSDTLPNWDNTDTILNSLMTGAGYSTNYSVNIETRLTGEGNGIAVGQVCDNTSAGACNGVNPSIIQVQNSVFDNRSGSTAAAEIIKPKNVHESSGQYLYNYDTLLGYPNIYFSPTSPYGRTSYTQLSFRRDAADLTNSYRQPSPANNSPYYGNQFSAAVNSATIATGSSSGTPGSYLTTWAGRGVAVYNIGGTNAVAGLYTIVSVASDGSTITLDRSPSTSGTALANASIDVGGDPNTSIWQAALSCASGTANITRTNTAYPAFTNAMVGEAMFFYDSSGSSSNGAPLGTGFVALGTTPTVSSVTDSNHLTLSASPCPSTNGVNGYARMGDTQPGLKFFALTGNAPYGDYNFGPPFGTGTFFTDLDQLGFLNFYETANFPTISTFPWSSAIPFGGNTWFTVTVREELCCLYRFHEPVGNTSGPTQIFNDSIDQIYDPFFSAMVASDIGGAENELVINNGVGAVGETEINYPVTAAGTGYTDSAEEAVSGGHGSGMTVIIRTDGSGHIISASLGASGPGGNGNYIDGDVLTIAGGSGGQITLHNVRTRFATMTAGSGYSNASGISLTGGHCTGVTADTITTGGALVAVNIDNPGTGCHIGDVLTVPGGTGGTVTVRFLDVYAIGSYVDPNHVYLTTPPCPSGACTGQLMKGSYQASGRTTTWINGLTNIDVNFHAISWQDPHDPLILAFSGLDNTYGVGRGQIEIAPQMTRKDPTQANTAVGYYYDDLIFSAQPPDPFLGTSVAPPATITGADRIRLRKGDF